MKKPSADVYMDAIRYLHHSNHGSMYHESLLTFPSYRQTPTHNKNVFPEIAHEHPTASHQESSSSCLKFGSLKINPYTHTHTKASQSPAIEPTSQQIHHKSYHKRPPPQLLPHISASSTHTPPPHPKPAGPSSAPKRFQCRIPSTRQKLKGRQKSEARKQNKTAQPHKQGGSGGERGRQQGGREGKNFEI
jgi:hypothetical protein